MKRKPPAFLVFAVAAYVAYLVWMLVVDFKPVVAGRLIASAVLFFFVFRGSRVAGNLLAILCGLSALVVLVAAVAAFGTSAMSAALFALVAGCLIAFAAYLVFSSAMRTFQGKPVQLASRIDDMPSAQ